MTDLTKRQDSIYTEVYALRKALGIWEGPSAPLLEIVTATDKKYATEQVITLARVDAHRPGKEEDDG